MENYKGSIHIQFDQMPSIKLVSFIPNRTAGLWERLTIATKSREFTLLENWKLELEKVSYKTGLNGTIEVPVKNDSSRTIIFDGASIPFPWLISLLSIGILRPLGVTLIGSIVHDYAYRYGKLNVIDDNNNVVEVPLERHKADKLFRDIIGTINGLPPVGYIAWLAVRIGWLWIPYNGKRYTGKKPVLECIVVLLIILSLLFLCKWVGVGSMLTGFIGLYIGLYFSSVALQYYYSVRAK